MKALKKVPLELVVVEFTPPHNEMEFGKLYYSEAYKTTNHLCPCGCGMQTPNENSRCKRCKRCGTDLIVDVGDSLCAECWSQS